MGCSGGEREVANSCYPFTVVQLRCSLAYEHCTAIGQFSAPQATSNSKGRSMLHFLTVLWTICLAVGFSGSE